MTVPTSTTSAEPIAVWEVPHPESLTMAELDEVLAVTGVDVAGDITWGKMIAALVVWVRRNAGENVTVEDVYRTVKMNQVNVTKVDPTNG